LLIVLALQSY